VADEQKQGLGVLVDGALARPAGQMRAPHRGLRHRGVHAEQHRVDRGDGEVARGHTGLEDPAEDLVVPPPQLLDPGLLDRGPLLRRQEEPQRRGVLPDGDADVLTDERPQPVERGALPAGRQALEAGGPLVAQRLDGGGDQQG
jgi:hypothetical protein